MAASKRSVLVGVFAERGRAEQAIRELIRAGFHADQVGLLTRQEKADRGATPVGDYEGVEAIGTVAGGITGTLVGGALAGAAVAGIPGIGPLLAAGLLAVLVT